MDDVRNIGKELHAIGNNLNQIAQYFHTGGARSEHIIQEINSGVKDLERIRKKVPDFFCGILLCVKEVHTWIRLENYSTEIIIRILDIVTVM